MSNTVKVMYIDVDVLYDMAKYVASKPDENHLEMNDYKFVVFGKNARLQTIASINESLSLINSDFKDLCIGRCPQLSSSTNMLTEVSSDKELNEKLSLSPNVNMPLAMQIAYHVDFVLSKMYDEFKYIIALSEESKDELNNLFSYQVKSTILYDI